MGRSLGVVIMGWVSGFLIAIAWGATRPNNPRLASTLSGWAIAGMVITGVLLVCIALSNRAKRRRARKQLEREAATVAAATAQRTEAKIAELEARLTREQEGLDAAAAALAAAELTATGHVSGGMTDPVPNPAAAESESVLRTEVLETFAELVGNVEPSQTAELAGQLEALLEKAH